MNCKLRYALWLVTLCAAATDANAKSLNILGVFHNGNYGQIKAEIDSEGSDIQSVTTYSFRMADGYNTTRTDYELVDGRYITADIDYHPGDYTYRLEVTMADGSTLLSECIDEDFTQTFMWLGDYPFTTAASGWEGHAPKVDISVDNPATPTNMMTVDGTVYYKGVSNHAQGHVGYVFDRPFTRFVTRYGIQDDRSVGNLTFRFWTDRILTDGTWSGGTAVATQKMYAKTNSARGDAPCVRDLELDMTGKSTLVVDALSDGSNAGDHAHLLLARLYTPLPDETAKEPQTVTFLTEGGDIPAGTLRLPLSAEASTGGEVAYRIIAGNDLAVIENGNELVPLFGSKGEIVVEATQYGDETHRAATAYVTFSFNACPDVQLLTSYPTGIPGVSTAYVLVDTKGRRLESLDIEIFDNALSLNPVSTVDVSAYFDNARPEQTQIVAFPFNASTDAVHRITYSIEGMSEPLSTGYREGNSGFDYLSDLTFRAGTGWDHWTADIAYDRTSALDISGQKYRKGFGTHAVGYVESTCDLSKYDRFVTDVGGQTISNPTRGRLSFVLLTASNGTVLAQTGNVAWNTRTRWDIPLDGISKIYIRCGDGGDGNTNDVACVGAPRFYYSLGEKRPQEISWPDTDLEINECRPTSVALGATASSGLDVIYAVTEGNEYARIENGNTLSIFNIPPESASVTVTAYQPGNNVWAPAQLSSRTFNVANRVVVRRDERIELDGPLNIKEMTVYADNFSAGQVLVKSGLVSVEKLRLKYSFIPGQWAYIAFPSDMNLDEVSDLNEKGYYLNNTREGNGAYFISAFNTRNRALADDGSEWESLTSPDVKGLMGYIMCVDGALGDEPVEITFTMDNLELDLRSAMRPVHLTLDMTYTDPGTEQAVYVKPANVKGNTLKVNVKFRPADTSDLPVNHARALRDMRVTYTPHHTGIRLTLPDQTPARVGIFDAKGEKLLKAVNYVSPMMIDLSDLPKGKYTLAVIYGPASAVKEFEL